MTYNSLGKSPLGLRPAEAGFEPGATTILFVEDEKLVREVACEILQSAGHRALQAQCAAEARRMFEQEEDVNLLVTDVMLPDANGTDLAEELGSRRPSLKTIFISGYPENAVTRGGFMSMNLDIYPSHFQASLSSEKSSRYLQVTHDSCTQAMESSLHNVLWKLRQRDHALQDAVLSADPRHPIHDAA